MVVFAPRVYLHMESARTLTMASAVHLWRRTWPERRGRPIRRVETQVVAYNMRNTLQPPTPVAVHFQEMKRKKPHLSLSQRSISGLSLSQRSGRLRHRAAFPQCSPAGSHGRPDRPSLRVLSHRRAAMTPRLGPSEQGTLRSPQSSTVTATTTITTTPTTTTATTTTTGTHAG